ncbi:hypothetical protein A3K72_03930 [Candidatus Woesearchaeota archaeon RBG_13_36_6]|nr:MAG: hypothetical protein A3K72_03930 [Candidatus Woesearchaeota archaeon RBG_13_36_6]
MIDKTLIVFVLRKLFRHRYIGAKHTDINNIVKGLPSHLRGRCKKIVQHLIRTEFLLTKPTMYGLHISLNPEKLEEIKEIIKPK